MSATLNISVKPSYPLSSELLRRCPDKSEQGGDDLLLPGQVHLTPLLAQALGVADDHVIIGPARRGYNRFDPSRLEAVWRV